MEKVVLQWLYQCRAINDIVRQCEILKDTDKCICKLVVHFDACELLQFNAELGDALLHRPGTIWPLFIEVVYALISVLHPLPFLTSSSQLLLLMRLHSLPTLRLYRIDHVSDLYPLRTEPRFYSFIGVVTALSIREISTEAASFRCERDSCPDKQRYIRLHTAGATEAMTMAESGCHLCGHKLTEELSQRVLADKVYMTLVPHRALSMCSRAWERYQGLQFVLRSDLCDLVRVGYDCEVIGVPTHSLGAANDQHSAVRTQVEVNNVLPVPSPLPTTLSPQLTDLLQGSQSPWILSSLLAYSFAGHLCPPGSYHRLKMAILLSLASLDTSDKTRALHLVAMGTDTPLLTELLRYGGSLSKRSTVHSTTFDLYGGARKEGSSIFIDGGALSLAGGGVCLMGSLGAMKRDLKDKLERSLESGCVEVSVPKRLRVSELQTVSLPFSCALWGTTRHTEASTISKSLFDRLGLVLSCDPTPCYEDSLSAVITRHTLDTAMGYTTVPLLSSDIIIELVSRAITLEPILEESAETLLESFYVGSRRVRGSDIPNTALDTMKAMALSHAKLRLRKTATQDDALLAVLLYEECLVDRFGYSVLNVSPSPHLKDLGDSGSIGTEFAGFMRGLLKRVVEFCKCSNPTVALIREE